MNFHDLFLFAEGSNLKRTPLERCQEPLQTGKGFWIGQDLRFGYGLNVARTRHASEIIKIFNPDSNSTENWLFVFGGFNL